MRQQPEVVLGVVGVGVEVGPARIEVLAMRMPMGLVGVMAVVALMMGGMLVSLLRGSVEAMPRKGNHTVVVGLVDIAMERLGMILNVLHGGYMSDIAELAAVMR